MINVGLNRPPEGGPFVTYATLGGDDIRVEIERSPDGFMPVSGDRPLGRVERLFEPVFSAVEGFLHGARRTRPDEISLRFGVKVTGGGNAVIAKDLDSGSFQVSMTWKASPESGPDR
jgi:Trypsin-co-occurring domain 1